MDYLSLPGVTITQCTRAAGYARSVAESSLRGMDRYYRQDENSPNAIVSATPAGALVGLQLLIRRPRSVSAGR